MGFPLTDEERREYVESIRFLIEAAIAEVSRPNWHTRCDQCWRMRCPGHFYFPDGTEIDLGHYFTSKL